jgi:hypothetical protein
MMPDATNEKARDYGTIGTGDYDVTMKITGADPDN